MVLLLRQYDEPVGKVRRRFIHALAVELEGLWENLCNYKRFIVFHMVILQRDHHVTGVQDIPQQLLQKMNMWEVGSIKLW